MIQLLIDIKMVIKDMKHKIRQLATCLSTKTTDLEDSAASVPFLVHGLMHVSRTW